MGAEKSSGAKMYFVNNGKLLTKEKDGTTDSFDKWTGKISSIYTKEKEYEGDKYLECRVVLDDGTEKGTIVFRLGSWFSHNFFCRVQKIDLLKPVTVGVYGSKKDDAALDAKPTNFCYMYQDGKKIESDKALISPPAKVKVNKKTITDWSGSEDEMIQLIEEVNKKVGATQVAPEAHAEAAAQPASDLPF